MSIEIAQKKERDIVKHITHTTIEAIYPHYYPRGAVDFFLAHHSDESIAEDIANRRVYIYRDNSQNAVGTVTIKGSEICRLFVLPEYQGRGYGRALLDLAETETAKSCGEIVIDASLAAKRIYLNRGYVETEYHTIKTPNGDFLCYDVMKKRL